MKCARAWEVKCETDELQKIYFYDLSLVSVNDIDLRGNYGKLLLLVVRYVASDL